MIISEMFIKNGEKILEDNIDIKVQALIGIINEMENI